MQRDHFSSVTLTSTQSRSYDVVSSNNQRAGDGFKRNTAANGSVVHEVPVQRLKNQRAVLQNCTAAVQQLESYRAKCTNQPQH